MMIKIQVYWNLIPKSLRDVLMFMLITLTFHFAYREWNVYLFDIKAFADFNLWLTDLVYQISLWLNVHILGFNIREEFANTMRFSNDGYISINLSCSGFKQFYQVLFLFLLFPGPWKHKAWYIPMSIFVMFLTNIFRIIGLSVILLWKPEYWDFSHDWIFRPFFYVVIFALWVLWVEKFSATKQASVSSE